MNSQERIEMLDDGLSYSKELIGPQLADQYLQTAAPNRWKRTAEIKKLARAMAEGKWFATGQSIKFNPDGELVDGQHRLSAVLESNTVQLFHVIRGVTKAASSELDTGIPRTLVDAARISGSDPELTQAIITLTRAIEAGQRHTTGSKSNDEKLNVVAKHRESAKWVLDNFPTKKGVKGIRNAATLAAVGRAWYMEQDKARLKRYCEVLMTGNYERMDEKAAFAMFLYFTRNNVNFVSTAQWRDTFLRVQNSIHKFMRGEPADTARVVSKEFYQLKK